MIERASEFGASAAAPLISGDTSHQSAGDMLRKAREAHGLDAAVVAAALKVPVQKIEALEDDDIDALPDPVFARALAASMCRALRIDPKPVLARLPDARNPGLHTQPAMPSFRTASVQRSNGVGSKALLIVVALLLAAAAALFWLPQSMLDQLSASVDSVMTRGAEPAGNPQAAGSVDSNGPGAATDAASSQTAPATATQPGSPQLAPAPVAGAPTTPAPAVPAAAPSVAAADAASGSQLVVFTVRTESWISVTEPGGKQLIQRVVPAGEIIGLNGTPPLQVVVGRASGVDVQVRGKALDLAPLTRGGTVARFEIKP